MESNRQISLWSLTTMPDESKKKYCDMCGKRGTPTNVGFHCRDCGYSWKPINENKQEITTVGDIMQAAREMEMREKIETTPGRDYFEKAEYIMAGFLTDVVDLPIRQHIREHGDGTPYDLSSRLSAFQILVAALMNILREKYQ